MMICFWNKHRLLISSEMTRPQKPGQWNAYTLPTLKITFQIDNKRAIAKRVLVYLPIRWATNYQNSAQINALQFQKRRRIEFIGQPKTYFGTVLQKRRSTPKFLVKALKTPWKLQKGIKWTQWTYFIQWNCSRVIKHRWPWTNPRFLQASANKIIAIINLLE